MPFGLSGNSVARRGQVPGARATNMRRGAGLNADQAGRQLPEERQDVATLQLTADDQLAGSINAMYLENRLGISKPIVVTVCMLAPPNRGSLSSTHIHGTHVPGGGAVHSSQPPSPMIVRKAENSGAHS